jgi:hypothetical protein
LLDKPCAEGIGASHLKDTIHAAEHLCDEFVPGQNEADPLRIPLPDAVAHETECCEAALFSEFDEPLILWFAGLFGI